MEFTMKVAGRLGLVSLLLMGAFPSGQAIAGTVTYIYADPLGSPLAEADVNGNVTSTYDYRPYGSSYTGSGMSAASTGPGFTGHVNEPDTALIYMQARYYDPATGRFLSVDPVGPAEGQLFTFNRFAYANNDPIGKEDPDGRCTGSLLSNSDGSCLGAGGGYTTMPQSLPGRPAQNLVDPQVAASAKRAANEALRSIPQVSASRDELAKNWGRAVQPVADKFDTEIGSKIFRAPGGYKFSPAVSDGVICSKSRICSVNVYNSPDVAGGVLSGYIHTHPNNLGLSGSDLYVAYNMWHVNGLLGDAAAYASQPNGQVRKWSTDMLQRTTERSWDDMAKKDSVTVP